jgi:hypothetical protein
VWELGGGSLRSLLLHVLHRSLWLGSQVELPWGVLTCLRESHLEVVYVSLGPSLHSRLGGGVVVNWHFPKFASIGVANSGVVSEFAAFSTLVRKT